jgi:hypothetical protein
MGSLEADGTPYEEVDYVGVAIRRFSADQLHCALIYKLDEGELRLVHLRFHHDLERTTPAPPFRWAQISLDTDNKQILAVLIDAIGHSATPIPYGLNPLGIVFDKDTGELLPPPIGKGLTCATFIIAVFQTYGYTLVQEASWPSRQEDETWQRHILDALEAHATPEHVEAARADVGAKRFRPEEVVGATIHHAWPVAFDNAHELAKQVLEDLDAAA